MGDYRCIIIDDDAYAVEGLEKYIAMVPTLVLYKSYTDPMLALLELAGSDMVDLILMDIDMPYINGIELARQLRGKTRKLIFTTAHTQYGYEAFEVCADAYLLKPYTLTRFAATTTRLLTATQDIINENRATDDYFFVKRKDENHTLIRVYFKDVITVESRQNYVMIYTLNQQILTYMSLTEMAGILARLPDFVKYHRSFIINLTHIGSITGNTLKMANGLQITVGEHFRKDFSAFLEKKILKAGRRA
jgi:DNA-binding LytR/AlgR family response regulator